MPGGWSRTCRRSHNHITQKPLDKDRLAFLEALGEKRDRVSRLRRKGAIVGIICLCGSSRYVAEMAVIGWYFEKNGWIALGLHLLPEWYTKESDHQAEHEGIKEQMDELHKRKIDLADVVFVVNSDGYIGESTRSEIEYAESLGIPIVYQEDRPEGQQ